MSVAAAKNQRSSARSVLESRPLYELRASGLAGGEMALEIWQLPSPSTPRLKQAELTASLRGRQLRLIETRVLRRLKQAGTSLNGIKRDQTGTFRLEEDLALNLALLFRVLAPMRSIDNIRAVSEGIDRMSREEAGYWLGMAVHRVYPRRVLAALRVLLTTP